MVLCEKANVKIYRGRGKSIHIIRKTKRGEFIESLTRFRNSLNLWIEKNKIDG